MFYFTQHNNFQIHPYSSNFFDFNFSNVCVFHSVYIPMIFLFTHFFLGTWISSRLFFQVIVNSSSINIVVKMPFLHYFGIPRVYSRSGIVESYEISIYSLITKYSYCFPKKLDQPTFSTIVNESSFSLASMPTPVTVLYEECQSL